MDPSGDNEQVKVATETLEEGIASASLGVSTPNASVPGISLQQAIQASDHAAP
ncbi:UNVERIFIED_CONTAM: hypothetical protein Sangu_2703500 [Sesamum angustifolium]|uniref:Uncharacterized protein n=1 Tax=Sesamum angustifolium TaxID=2727405 RepID=A0AAW2IYF3_9LAMI